jgi:hypothetical protein
MALWIQAGGSRATANIAAAIAMAESGGESTARNSIGATGLWQIYNGPNTSLALKDPVANARAAVAKWKAAGGFSPWTTFTGADTGPGGSRGPRTFLNFLGGGSVPAGKGIPKAGKPHNVFNTIRRLTKPKPKPKPTKMLSPAQKTWGTLGSGGGLDQLRSAAGISPKGMAVDTSINNPWLQAILTHIDNLVGAGQLSELQGNALKIGHLQNALPFLTGDNALAAQGMIKQLIPDTSVSDEGVLLAKIRRRSERGT